MQKQENIRTFEGLSMTAQTTQELNETQKANSDKAQEGEKAAGQPGTGLGTGPGTEPSGPRGDNPGTAGPGHTGVQSKTPENSAGHINPSAPEDANVTPGSVGKK